MVKSVNWCTVSLCCCTICILQSWKLTFLFSKLNFYLISFFCFFFKHWTFIIPKLLKLLTKFQNWEISQIISYHLALNWHMFHSEFLDPLSSISVGYKIQSNDVNDSKKEDLSQLFSIYWNILRQPELTNCTIPVIFKIQLALTF